MEDVFATSGSSRGATRRAAEPLVAPDTTSARLTAPARKSDDKRAKQLVAEKGRTYEEALTHLLKLMREGWAAKGKGL